MKLADRIEQDRRKLLIEGSKAIDTNLGQAVEDAFNAGYSADQVHAMLSAGNAINTGPALRTREQD
jgi:hypothetical protein